MHDVELPKWGMTMQDGTISEWVKEVGDSVEEGDVIAIIETEKVDADLEAPESGVLKEGTDPVDGIFCGGNPDDFVGPDNANYIDRKPADSTYFDKALEVVQSDEAHDFSQNERESSAL